MQNMLDRPACLPVTGHEQRREPFGSGLATSILPDTVYGLARAQYVLKKLLERSSRERLSSLTKQTTASAGAPGGKPSPGKRHVG